MRWIDQAFLPLAALASTALGVITVGRELERQRCDRAVFWRRVLLANGFTLGLLSLLSGWLESVHPTLWHSGWHLHFDLVPAARPLRWLYLAALGLPVLVWGLSLLAGLALAAAGRGSGGAGFRTWGAGSGRGWMLAAALPLVVALVLALPRLGGGPAAYPAFTWSAVAVVLASLLALALVPGHELPSPDRLPPQDDSSSREPWPRALRNRGLDLCTVARWGAAPARPSPPPAPGRPSLKEQAPAELVAALDALLKRGQDAGEHGRALLVLGAEDDGRLEAVAAAAGEMHESFLKRTLIICPDGAEALAEALRPLLPAGAREVFSQERPGPIDLQRAVWVLTAEACAETVLPRLGESGLGAGVGLVVWWDLDRFTGVPAAHLWAVSHRLYRLLAHFGSGDLRTIALAWCARFAAAQAERFVHRLLPHVERDRSVLHLRPSWRRSTELHLLGSAARYFELRPTQTPDRTHPLVLAAEASIEAGWSTHLALPEDAARDLARPLERVTVGQRRLLDVLAPRPSEAEVRLLGVAATEALSLPERLSELGRAVDGAGPHHVGVVTDHNAYVDYLLRSLAVQPASLPTASRRLVAAVGHPRLLTRHLLRALAELPGTGASLRRDFLAYETTLEQTLEELHAKGELVRSEVRSLSPAGRLDRDFEYRSLAPAGGRPLPFHSAGGDQIAVRDPAAAHHNHGEVLRVDADRLLIEAYPHRILAHQARRYRVRDWSSVEDASRRGYVECQLEARPVSSLRLRRGLVQAVRPRGDRSSLGRPELGLAKQSAGLIYEEWVDGALHLTREVSGRIRAERLLLQRALSLRFDTTALLLLFPQRVASGDLAALAQALRLLLPVHLGVGEDDLEVVSFSTAEAGMRGLALVELYDRGFGLLEPIAEDGELLVDLLSRTRSWLAACDCRSDEGCPRCTRTPAALVGHVAPRRAAALTALSQALE